MHHIQPIGGMGYAATQCYLNWHLEFLTFPQRVHLSNVRLANMPIYGKTGVYISHNLTDDDGAIGYASTHLKMQ